MEPSGSSSKNPYPPYAQYDGDVPSKDPPPPPQLENWDEYAYLYSDRKGVPEGRSDAPGEMPRQPTDMLRTLADYGDQPVDIPEPTQDDGYWEEEEEEDELKFVNV